MTNITIIDSFTLIDLSKIFTIGTKMPKLGSKDKVFDRVSNYSITERDMALARKAAGGIVSGREIKRLNNCPFYIVGSIICILLAISSFFGGIDMPLLASIPTLVIGLLVGVPAVIDYRILKNKHSKV
ncbi:MAG: hypothetical protein WCV73_05010 [Patescibacteria group bacterium]